MMTDTASRIIFTWYNTKVRKQAVPSPLCRVHRDLEVLDEHYAEDRTWKRKKPNNKSITKVALNKNQEIEIEILRGEGKGGRETETKLGEDTHPDMLFLESWK